MINFIENASYMFNTLIPEITYRSKVLKIDTFLMPSSEAIQMGLNHILEEKKTLDL